MNMKLTKDDAVTIRARFPQAHEVYALGEFNNWSTTATPLRALGSGFFEVTLSVASKPSQICFFVWERGHTLGRVMDCLHEEDLLSIEGGGENWGVRGGSVWPCQTQATPG